MGCSSDDNITPIPSTQISKSYDVSSIYDNSVNGTAKFIKNDDNSTTVELKLTGIPTGIPHPASINYNTAAEGGAVAITLGTVNGDTGFSTISFSTLDDGTPITYDDLLGFDGYVNVLYSVDEPDNNIAQGDIGENELTGVSTTYNLGEKDVPGISGSVIFSQRENGESLAVLQLINPTSGNMYPAYMNNNTAVEGGSIALTFNPVDGDTGISATNVVALDNDVSFLYIDIVDFDGYIEIQQNQATPEIIVAEGDIGQNQLTGVATSYVLDEVDGSSANGTATFYARNNGEALAVILLLNTTIDVMHPAAIYSNDIALGGDIIFTFNPVNGNTGVSQTNVAVLNDNSLFGYADVLGVNGHIKVLLSDVQATVISQGNIGSND
ncbi:hypothetical protein GCM10010976_33060 [Bizionia arctica]|uniref:Uncharacterized protein n=2 Tax=Bizionia arctica TaxID=1495645 RepID=A0A917LVP3_9FLAO|nr:hypothetical protein GCM10010976_33060 [Bizionia arctica]